MWNKKRYLNHQNETLGYLVYVAGFGEDGNYDSFLQINKIA